MAGPPGGEGRGGEGKGALATTINERQRKKGNEKHKMNIPIKEQVSVSSQCILLSILLRKLFRNVIQCCVVPLRQSSRAMILVILTAFI